MGILENMNGHGEQVFDPSLSRVILRVVFLRPLGELVKRDSELCPGIRGGEFLKCRQACMVSEFVANVCTKVKVDEARSYRIGASNS
jgi:hypothetical protein